MSGEAQAAGPAISGNTAAFLVVITVLAASSGAVALLLRDPSGASGQNSSSTANADWGNNPAATAAPPPGSLVMTLISPGRGRKAATGDRVQVQYTGRLQDGTAFDSSLDGQKPFEFVLGQGRVIRGWDQGILGMQLGEKRRLVVPPALAYGARGRPPKIPPNATLTFDVEMISIGR
ncbi:MAG: FKBP-type peptidyl-prolyl cis-trans isomerase [Polyangiaceae bacterium]